MRALRHFAILPHTRRHLLAALFFGLGEKCGLPNLAKRYGMQPFITCGSVLNVVACALLTIPAASDNLASLLVLWSLANIGFSCAVIPAQVRTLERMRPALSSLACLRMEPPPCCVIRSCTAMVRRRRGPR